MRPIGSCCASKSGRLTGKSSGTLNRSPLQIASLRRRNSKVGFELGGAGLSRGSRSVLLSALRAAELAANGYVMVGVAAAVGVHG